MKKLECSLRKTCQFCGASYGRKIRKPTADSEYFEAKQSFKRSKYCGLDCSHKALSHSQQKDREARTVEERQNKIILPAAMDAFLYSRPMEDV